MSKPVILIPFQLVVPGVISTDSPIRDFRPVVESVSPNTVTTDDTLSDDESLLEVEEVSSDEDGSDEEDPKGVTVVESANSSKETEVSQKDAQLKQEESLASAGTDDLESNPSAPLLQTFLPGPNLG